MPKQRIGIDCRLSGIAHAGIGRYIESLLSEFKLNSNELSQLKLVLFFSSQKQAATVLGKRYAMFASDAEIRIVPVRHYSFAEQIILPWHFYRSQLDLLHVPHFNLPFLYRKKSLITIHDLLWHEQRGSQVTTLPQWQYWLKYAAYRFITAQAIRRAKAILVPSNYVKKTIQKRFKSSKRKITVTPEGVAKRFFKKSKKKHESHKLLYIGSLYPHKNVVLILEALKRLAKYELTIVSSRDAFYKDLQKSVRRLELKSRVHFLHGLEDEALLQELQTATCLIQPSLSEGFGLTGIEAMAAGTPVLASNIPVFKKVYKDAALFFNPKSETSFIKVVKALPNKQNALIKKGRELAENYNWAETAELTLREYQRALDL